MAPDGPLRPGTTLWFWIYSLYKSAQKTSGVHWAPMIHHLSIYRVDTTKLEYEAWGCVLAGCPSFVLESEDGHIPTFWLRLQCDWESLSSTA